MKNDRLPLEKIRTGCFIIITLILSSYCVASVIKVPKDYSTIQKAVDASLEGDEVVVSPGKYSEFIAIKGKNS